MAKRVVKATRRRPRLKLDAANRDCLAKAKAGEPKFIILGRDPDGGTIVRLWAQRRAAAGDTEHAEAVFAIADAMDAWRAAGNLPESAPEAERYPAINSAERFLQGAIETLRSHVEACRRAFFTLAQHRAADMVIHQGRQWADATNYIDAEMQALDQQLAQLAPPPPEGTSE